MHKNANSVTFQSKNYVSICVYCWLCRNTHMCSRTYIQLAYFMSIVFIKKSGTAYTVHVQLIMSFFRDTASRLSKKFMPLDRIQKNS
jgi:hypothetical protein